MEEMHYSAMGLEYRPFNSNKRNLLSAIQSHILFIQQQTICWEIDENSKGRDKTQL